MTAKKKQDKFIEESTQANADSYSSKQAAPIKSFWKAHLWPGLLLFCLAFMLYANSAGFGYVLDDRIVLSENKYVQKGLAGIKDILSKETFAGYFGEQLDLVVGARYRPLSLVSFAIEYEFFGLNTKVSHFVNVILYALTGLLLYRILCLFFPVPTRKPWYLSLAFIASLLFIIHPLHTEVVANIKGRDEMLCLIGVLATTYLVWKYINKDKLLCLILAGVCFFFSLLAKENALTFLAVIPISLFFFTQKFHQKAKSITGVLFLASISYLFLRYQVIGYFLSSGKEITDIMNNPFYGLSIGEKFGTIFNTLGQYLKLLIYPHPLTHDYYPYQVPITGLFDWKSLLSILAHLVLGLYAVFNIKNKRIPAYGILFYIITLSIVSNIPFTVGTFMNERFLYISSIGFCIIMGWLISRKIPEWTKEDEEKVNILGTGLLLLLLITYSWKTISRIPAWESQLSLNTAAIKVSKNSARANCFMATALFEQYKVETEQQKRYALLDDINKYINKSLEINPRYGSAILMKSGVVAENYNRDRNLDKLLNEFYEMLKVNPGLSYIDEYLIYLNNGRTDRKKLADFYFRMGAWFANEARNSNLALKYLQQFGLSVDPNNVDLNRAIGQIYQKTNQPQKAAEYLRKANQ